MFRLNSFLHELVPVLADPLLDLRLVVTAAGLQSVRQLDYLQLDLPEDPPLPLVQLCQQLLLLFVTEASAGPAPSRRGRLVVVVLLVIGVVAIVHQLPLGADRSLSRSGSSRGQLGWLLLHRHSIKILLLAQRHSIDVCLPQWLPIQVRLHGYAINAAPSAEVNGFIFQEDWQPLHAVLTGLLLWDANQCCHCLKGLLLLQFLMCLANERLPQLVNEVEVID